MRAGLLGLMAIFMLACGHSYEGASEQEGLERAFAIHQESVILYKEVAKKRDSLSIQLYGLDHGLLDRYTSAQFFPDSLKRLNLDTSNIQDWKAIQTLALLDSSLLSWNECLIEVPLHEDYPNHHVDHRRGPSLIKDIVADSLVEYQQIHLEKLRSLSKEFDALMQLLDK